MWILLGSLDVVVDVCVVVAEGTVTGVIAAEGTVTGATVVECMVTRVTAAAAVDEVPPSLTLNTVAFGGL